MEKWIFGLSEDEKQRLEALCARIGIPSNTPEHMKWEMVGRRLASEQPEFREKRGRGRPSVGRFGLDYQRANEIKARRRERVAAGESRRITDLSLIKELAESDHKLFPQATDIDVLAQSVSRGNKVWAEESAKAQQSLKQIMARERAEKRREARREAKMRKQARGNGLRPGRRNWQRPGQGEFGVLAFWIFRTEYPIQSRLAINSFFSDNHKSDLVAIMADHPNLRWMVRDAKDCSHIAERPLRSPG